MKKISISLILLALVATSCKSTDTCESLGLQTAYADLSIEKVNDDVRQVVRYKCVIKKPFGVKK